MRTIGKFFYDPDAIFSVRLGQVMMPLITMAVLAFVIGATIVHQ